MAFALFVVFALGSVGCGLRGSILGTVLQKILQQVTVVRHNRPPVFSF